MNILLTNDDGIHAKGISALHGELSLHHDVNVVAPESEMSAVGHAISLTRPIRVRKVYKNGTFFGYGVEGTPADCVKIAVQELLKRPPDLVLSGINQGANVGVNVLYSGTVSAATEGAFLGIKSAAISLDSHRDPDFTYAAGFSHEVIRFIMDNGLKKGTALNVNIPAVPAEKIQGVSITRQGLSIFKESFDRRIDPRGNAYYWLSGEIPEGEVLQGSDEEALLNDRISITPISYDLTSRDEMERLKNLSLPEIKR